MIVEEPLTDREVVINKPTAPNLKNISVKQIEAPQLNEIKVN